MSVVVAPKLRSDLREFGTIEPSPQLRSYFGSEKSLNPSSAKEIVDNLMEASEHFAKLITTAGEQDDPNFLSSAACLSISSWIFVSANDAWTAKTNVSALAAQVPATKVSTMPFTSPAVTDA